MELTCGQEGSKRGLRGSPMASRGSQKKDRDPSFSRFGDKSPPRGGQGRFLRGLGGVLGGSWPDFGVILGPKCGQEGSKRGLRGSKMASRGSKKKIETCPFRGLATRALQEGVQGGSWGVLGGSWPDFEGSWRAIL